MNFLHTPKLPFGLALRDEFGVIALETLAITQAWKPRQLTRLGKAVIDAYFGNTNRIGKEPLRKLERYNIWNGTSVTEEGTCVAQDLFEYCHQNNIQISI